MASRHRRGNRTMHILIDGYNLIRQSPELLRHERTSLEAGRLALIQRLVTYQRQRGHRITVVFDGWQGGSPFEERDRSGGVVIRYSRRGETADAVIRRLAREGREEVLVVTSDRGIAEHLGRRGAVAVSSLEFADRLEKALLKDAAGPPDDPDAEDAPRGGKRKGMARRPSRREKAVQARLRKI